MNPADEEIAEESADIASSNDSADEERLEATGDVATPNDVPEAVERDEEQTSADVDEPPPAGDDSGDQEQGSPEVAAGEADEAGGQELCVETAGLPDITPPSARRPRVPWWPFEVYAIAWLALIAYTVVGLPHENDSAPAVLQDVYPAVLLAAVVLTAVGPALSLATWLGAWLANGRRGPGLLTAALVRGALFTLVGVLSWWGTLTLVDAVRLGLVR